MKQIAEITSIVEQYAKHDWVVRRAALSSATIAAVGAGLASLYPDVEIEESANEALWFSRRTLPDREAWELRRLSGSPFALVAVLEDSFSKEEREDILSGVEQRMFDGSHPEPTSH
jgi:hypothetical protein